MRVIRVVRCRSYLDEETPVAFIIPGEEGVEASRFGARMIHDSLDEIYEARSVTIDVSGIAREWTAWLVDGCPVAWTDDSADQGCLAPVIRFGLIGALDLGGYRLRGEPISGTREDTVWRKLQAATS